MPRKPKPETVLLARLPALAREARLAAELTQDEAAERLDVSKSAISRAESDKYDPGRYVELQRSMIRKLAGWTVEGPFYQITRR